MRALYLALSSLLLAAPAAAAVSFDGAALFFKNDTFDLDKVYSPNFTADMDAALTSSLAGVYSIPTGQVSIDTINISLSSAELLETEHSPRRFIYVAITYTLNIPTAAANTLTTALSAAANRTILTTGFNTSFATAAASTTLLQGVQGLGMAYNALPTAYVYANSTLSSLFTDKQLEFFDQMVLDAGILDLYYDPALPAVTGTYPNISDTNYYTGGRPNLRADYGAVFREGASSNPTLPTVAPITGIPYNSSLKDGNITYTQTSHGVHTDLGVLAKDTSGGDACSARGFKCDFSEKSKMGPYQPLDFVWKIVDPLDYGKDDQAMKTLPCEVDISAIDSTNSGSEYFYVGTGQENVGSTDYCDVEAIRRVVNDAALNMTDMIRIRGETARLNNQYSSMTDLIGEQFDLICMCTTTLSTEASVSLKTMKLLTKMTSTGQARTMGVELLLFADDFLLNEVVYARGDEIPGAAPNVYLLARQLLDNDWDVQLQINKCVACSMAVNYCNTTVANDYAVMFYEACDVVIGGPQYRPPNPSAWYNNPSISTKWKPLGKWSDANPLVCPYHAVGFQKFRIQGTNTMKMTCAITACTGRPCRPCIGLSIPNHRKLLARRTLFAENKRKLQAADDDSFDTVELTTVVRFQDPNALAGGNKDESNSNKQNKGAKGTNIFMLILLLLVAAVSMFVVRKMMKQRNEDNTKRSVAPAEKPERSAETGTPN